MDRNEMIAKLVERRLNAATTEHEAAKASITEAFADGYRIEASQMEAIARTQFAFSLWTSIQRMVARSTADNLAERLANKVSDLQEDLLNQGAGGSTSGFSNGKTEVERKVTLSAYKALAII